MSSEIIGELGQVGLKVSVPENSEPNITSSPVKREDNLKKRSGYRVKRFRQEWMMFDIFKDWLRPHATSAELAYCTACNRTIKGGKSELEKHAAGRKHLSMLKPQSEQGSKGEMVPVQSSNFSNEDINFRCHSLDLTENGNSSQEGESTYLNEISHKPPVAIISETSYYGKAFVTRPAPHWKTTAVINGNVTTLDLNDYSDRFLILVFYPNDFCKISSSEINALSDAAPNLRFHGIEIVACSVDSHLVHLAWCRVGRLEGGVAGTKIALLADPTHTIASAYGVYLPDKGHTLRAHFLIDRRGIIRHMSVNDTPFGRSTTEIIRLSKALLFNESTEECCPVDWQPPPTTKS